MATQPVESPVTCGMCPGGTVADETIEYEVRGNRYRIGLCFLHVTAFDTFMQRLMWRSELLPEKKAPRPRPEQLPLPILTAVKSAPEPEPEPARPERRKRTRQVLPSDLLVWRLSDHARTRALQRGFPIEQVLRAAARPHHTTPGDTQDTRAHFLDDMLVIVNPSRRTVVTVMFRHDDDYQTWLATHPAASA